MIATGNPCPICRDEYLILDYRNVELLKQFISPYSGKLLSYSYVKIKHFIFYKNNKIDSLNDILSFDSFLFDCFLSIINHYEKIRVVIIWPKLGLRFLPGN